MVLLLSHWFATIRIAEACEELDVAVLVGRHLAEFGSSARLSGGSHEAPRHFFDFLSLHIKFIQVWNGPAVYILLDYNSRSYMLASAFGGSYACSGVCLPHYVQVFR